MKRPSAARQRAFLAAYAQTASITKAAKAAKVDRGAHYDWLDSDPTYEKRFKAAGDRAGDLLEDEAVRRSHEGILEPIVYHGGFCYPLREKAVKKDDGTVEIVTVQGRIPLTIRKYSDRLLERLLIAFKPEKYRERVSAELTGKDGAPIEVSLADVLRDRKARREAA